MTEPALFWTLNPADERTHAVVLGDVESLCGVPLPAEVRLNRPWGALCLPCAIGATADLPHPDRMGTGNDVGAVAPDALELLPER